MTLQQAIILANDELKEKYFINKLPEGFIADCFNHIQKMNNAKATIKKVMKNEFYCKWCYYLTLTEVIFFCRICRNIILINGNIEMD